MLTFRKTLEQLGIKSQKMFEKRKCYECRQALPEEEVTITAIDIRKFLSMIPTAPVSGCVVNSTCSVQST
jgi:hypothetical protein